MDRRYRNFEERQAQEGIVAELSPAIAYTTKKQPSCKLIGNEELVRKQINDVLVANDEFERMGVTYSLEEVIARSHKRHPWLR